MIYPLIMLDPKLCKEARYNNLETRGSANRAALIMGLDPKTIRQIEKGTHATRYKKAKIYADAIKVPLAYLTKDDQDKYLFSKYEKNSIPDVSFKVKECMDYMIKKVNGIGYLPIVLDEYSNEIYRGEYHQKAHDAIDAALSYVDEHYCSDCNMSVKHEDFTWNHPEALTDEEMGVKKWGVANEH